MKKSASVLLLGLCLAAPAVAENATTAPSPSAPLTAQDITRRLLALIGDIGSRKDISPELVEKHFGPLGWNKPGRPTGDYGVGGKLTEKWFYSLESHQTASEYTSRSLRFEFYTSSSDNGADMSPVCVPIEDYKQPLTAAGFTAEKGRNFRDTQDEWSFSRDNRGARIRIGVDLSGRGHSKDVQACIWGVSISATMTSDDLAASFRDRAEQGEAEAEMELGLAYAEGRGVPHDDAEAVRWFHRADQDYNSVQESAQYHLGVMYESGRGVPRDDVQAAVWYRKAADGGMAKPDVFYKLGKMYAEGRGVARDDSEAVFLFRRAADKGLDVADDAQAVAWWREVAGRGNAGAQYVLGDMYRVGRGVAQDEAEAVAWYRKAALQGDVDARLSLGRAYMEGRGVVQDDGQAVTWFRKAVAQEPYLWLVKGYLGRGNGEGRARAVAWLQKTAGQGNAGAQFILGGMCRRGDGPGAGLSGEARDTEAAAWYRKAALQGDADAQFELGEMYRNGRYFGGLHGGGGGIPGDDKEAVAWLRKAADQGHAKAQLSLGRMYRRGFRPERDDGQAVAWFRKAAEQGNALAQTELGWMYASGRGVARDDEQAVAWYRKAAEQNCGVNCVWAQRNLGWAYVSGRGVAKDLAQGVDWYRKAAWDDATAEYNLGIAYRDGLGVGNDDAKAVAWFSRAARHSFTPASFNLDWMSPLGDGAPQDKTERARASSRFKLGWFYGDGSKQNHDYGDLPAQLQGAADQGDAFAQYILGRMSSSPDYLFGDRVTVKEDNGQAVMWYRKAADQGYALAQESLGLMYADGKGVEKDDAQAAGWYRKAAEQGIAYAQHILGLMYEKGRGVAKDDAQAEAWLRKAAEQGTSDGRFFKKREPRTEGDKQRYDELNKSAGEGDANAQYRLGLVFRDGRLGVWQSIDSATRWFERAAEQGNADAEYELGLLYMRSINEAGYNGAERDVQAVEWFRKAADQGHADAQYNLGVAFRDGEGTARDDGQAVAWFNKAADQGQSAAKDALRRLREQGRDGEKNER